MPIKLTCPTCGKPFQLPPSAVKRGYRNCSAQCKSIEMRRQAMAARHVPVQPRDYKIVPLTHGREAKVSNEDYDWIMDSHVWVVNSAHYATTDGGKMMHREIILRLYGEYKPLEVDHINLDRLDNRRENLRLGSRSQNMMNRNRQSLKGAQKNYNKWYASITVNKQKFSIGQFDTQAEAAWMYDQWALALHGEFANLNFEYVAV